MKIAVLILIALWPVACFAQGANTSKAPVAKLIRLHYANPPDIVHLLSGTVVPVAVADSALNAVVVRGNSDNVAKAVQMIQQLDVPQAKTSKRNVETTVYVIGATDKSALQAPAVPQNLQSVIRQLKAIFPYSTYSLLNSMLIRSRVGEPVYTTGMLKSFPTPPSASVSFPTIYTVKYDLQENPSPGAVALSNFRFQVREPIAVGTTQHSMADVDVSTGIDLPERQKVVVGKIDIDNGEAALFVVLSAHIE